MHKPLIGDLLEALADVHEGVGDLSRIRERLEAYPAAGYRRYYYEAILGRSPESAHLAAERVDNRLQCALDFIKSDEFAFGHFGLLRQLYPELPAKYFLHVPKSGGSTVIASQAASGDFALVMTPALVFDHCDDRLAYYGRMIASLRRGVRFFGLKGHPSGAFLIANCLKRENDEVFSVLREPFSTIISYINYILTVVSKRDDELSRAWLQNFTQMDIDFGKTIPDDILLRILKSIVPDNPICRALSGHASASMAIECIEILDIKIVGLSDLEKYLRMSGWPEVNSQNISTKYITNVTVSSTLRASIEAHIEEDEKLFRHLNGGKRVADNHI
jgi:hypothetical protein